MQFLIIIIIIWLVVSALKWLFAILSTTAGSIGLILLFSAAVVVMYRRGISAQYKPILAASLFALSGICLFGLGIINTSQLEAQEAEKVAEKDALGNQIQQVQEQRTKRIEDQVWDECNGVIIRVNGAAKMLAAAKAGKAIDSYFDESRMTDLLQQYQAEMSSCRQQVINKNR